MKRFNLNEFIWFAILLCLTAYIYYLLVSGNINNFIHPKMIKYMFFSITALIPIIYFQFKKSLSSRSSKGIRLGYILFMIPLALGFIVKPGALKSNIISTKGISLGSSSTANRRAIINEDMVKNEAPDNNTVIINDENYLGMLDEIEINLDEYMGRRISVTGFVFKDTEFNRDEFVIARMLLACCAADAQVIGFLCKADNTSELEGDQWIMVEGVIGSTQYKNSYMESPETIPIIIVERVEQIQAPENIYIYP